MGERPPAQPRREQFDGVDQQAYDRCIRRYHPNADAEEHHDIGEYFGALLNSPPMCAIASEFGTFVRTAGDRDDTYQHWEREFVDQVLSADWRTNVVQKVHIPDGLSTGVRMEAIHALRYGHEEDLTPDEKLLAVFIRQVVSGTVTDELWQQIVERMGVRGAVEYTGFILWLQWIMRMMQALDVEDPPDEEIDQLITDLDSGARKIPDYRVRIR